MKHCGKGDWGHTGHPSHRESARVFPVLEGSPDISRGEQRLAAEVALAQMRGRHVPTNAHERGIQILNVLARA